MPSCGLMLDRSVPGGPETEDWNLSRLSKRSMAIRGQAVGRPGRRRRGAGFAVHVAPEIESRPELVACRRPPVGIGAEAGVVIVIERVARGRGDAVLRRVARIVVDVEQVVVFVVEAAEPQNQAVRQAAFFDHVDHRAVPVGEAPVAREVVEAALGFPVDRHRRDAVAVVVVLE